MGNFLDNVKEESGYNDVKKFGQGLADGIRDLTGANTITKALNGANARADAGGHNDGHTTSGMDAALQAHADQQHPVK